MLLEVELAAGQAVLVAGVRLEVLDLLCVGGARPRVKLGVDAPEGVVIARGEVAGKTTPKVEDIRP